MAIKSSIACFVALTAAWPAWSQAPTVATIAVAGPMSGGTAHYGIDIRNAATLAIDDLNGRKLVIGGQRVAWKLQVEDDAGDPRQGTSVANKLCDERVAGVVGHINSGTAIPASPIYADCGLPFISPGATNPTLTQLGNATTFRLLANDNALVTGVAKYAAEALRLQRVAIVDDRTAYGQGVASTFRADARARGIEVVGEEYTTDQSIDFFSLLTLLKSKHPEAIFYGGSDGQAGTMLRQMDQLQMRDVRFLGGDGICTPQLATMAANLPILDQVICAEGGAPLSKMRGGVAWKARYDRRFPGEYALYAPYAYDAVMVLAEAMRQAGSTDPKRYLPALKAIDYKGLSADIRFDRDGDLLDAPITMYRFVDGTKVVIDRKAQP